MAHSFRSSRRRFLATGIAVPLLVPGHVLGGAGRPGANDKIGVAYLGAGRRANQLMDLPPEGRIVAACDVDRRRADAVARRRNCRAYYDRRKLLAAKDIDAVVIALPDHWHVLAALEACQAGKDVYLEKPLSLTIREGRVLVDAVRKLGRVLQTGSQRRSMAGHRKGCELVRNGRAGKIHTVLIMNYPSPWEARFPAQPVPPELDWDTWLGPAEAAPYHEEVFIQRSRPGWISLRPYSGGEMTGTGAHGFDQIQWALGMDHTNPVEVWCEGGKLQAPVYTAPENLARGDRLTSRGRRVFFRYADGIVVRLEEGESAAGATFVGDRGKVRIGNNTVSSNPPEIAQEPLERLTPHVAVSDNHIQNWFDCIRSRAKPIAGVEIGHRSAVMCHLGNIARWVGRKLTWDPQKEIFPGDDEANQFLDRPRRKGYELPRIA